MSVEIRRERSGKAAIYRAGTSVRLFAAGGDRTKAIRRASDFARAQGWTITSMAR